MKRTFSLILTCCALLPSASCGPELAQGLADATILDKVCVTGFKTMPIPPKPGDIEPLIGFQASFTNPQTFDAHGSIEIKMHVLAKEITDSVPPVNLDVESKPGFAMPVTTVYPAGVTDGAVSPLALTAPHGRFTTYDLEIYTNFPGINYDGSACHTFKATNVKI